MMQVRNVKLGTKSRKAASKRTPYSSGLSYQVLLNKSGIQQVYPKEQM